MKKLLLLAEFIILFSCATVHKNKIDKTHACIIQNSVTFPLNEESTSITVANDDFSLQFYLKKFEPKKNKSFCARIVVAPFFIALPEIKVGDKLTDLDCFKPGSGIAPDKSNKYKMFFMDRLAHHYLYYQSEENSRLKLIEKKGEYLKVELPFNWFVDHGSEIDMFHAIYMRFSMAMVIDHNLNGIIDKGELKRIYITIN